MTSLDMVVLHAGEPPRSDNDPWASGDAPRVSQLARAIAASRGWHGREATLVVRGGSSPMIAAFGRFDEATLCWLRQCSLQLAQHLPRVRWLDHAAVERCCAVLADTLTRRFGHDALRSYEFSAVPRGGLFVLAPLAYLLDIPADHLAPRRNHPTRPLVLIDDIAISGYRLDAVLSSLGQEREVIVATLHSHPTLRETLEARHAHLVAMVSAVDLSDVAPRDRGDDHGPWLDRWRARVGPRTPWIGEPERVAYPWNDPDVGVWNDRLEREEPGWDVVPPSRCLKSRGRRTLPVQIMPEASGPLVPTAGVMYGRHDGTLVIGDVDTGATYQLDDDGAAIWEALVACGDVPGAAQRLSAHDPSRAAWANDATVRLAEDLRAAGLLVDGGQRP